MVSHRVLAILVLSLAILIVVFAVLMSFYVLVSALGDESAARVLLWIGITCLMLFVTNLIFLVGCLGINAVAQRDENRG